MGINHFDPNLSLAGVILNNTGSERHANLVRTSVEMYTDIPVLGVLPRMRNNPIPERHMGLHLHKKNSQSNLLDSIATFLGEHMDIDKIYQIAHEAPLLASGSKTCLLSSKNEHIESIYTKSMGTENQAAKNQGEKNGGIENTGAKGKGTNSIEKPVSTVNIAYIYDDALWFYYQENFDALKNAGAHLIPLSILDEKPFSEQANNVPFDALYIGGGFPELYAEEISKSKHLACIKELVENNLPVYAECGGFMILSKYLHIEQDGTKKNYAMANVFPVETEFFKKPQGLGYITAHTRRKNPYHPQGSVWNGHEFHFSKSVSSTDVFPYVLNLNPGHGMQKAENRGFDGLVYKQCFAAYAHLFAPAVPHWAKNFINAAIAHKNNEGYLAQ